MALDPRIKADLTGALEKIEGGCPFRLSRLIVHPETDDFMDAVFGDEWKWTQGDLAATVAAMALAVGDDF